MIRRDKALLLLKKYKKQNYHYLGEGYEGVVFHNEKNVYKVFISKSSKIEDWKFAFLKSKVNKFKNRKHLINLRKVFKIDEIYVLKYNYNKNYREVFSINREEAISFLTEVWEEKIVFRDVKFKNFIRINNVIKYIDYGPNGDFINYNDNYFLNMAARVFIDLTFSDLSENEKAIIKRTSINNLKIKELKGFHEFLNSVFANIIFKQSNNTVKKYYNDIIKVNSDEDLINVVLKLNRNKILITNYEGINFERLFWIFLKFKFYIKNIIPKKLVLSGLYHKAELFEISFDKIEEIKKKVSLIIKVCPQDSLFLCEVVKHIIKQLSFPNKFFEIVLAIDKKENNFLREFNNKGSLIELYEKIDKLKKENIIDYYIELPEKEISITNKKWFGIETLETHSIKNIPITPQIYAFEKVKGDYILQMDSDVLIGRKDYKHSFLKDMIKALDENNNAISVGFNIPKDKSVNFLDYHAPKGGYVPEVRFGLIHKRRLMKLLPLPNEIIKNQLKLSWYRSLEYLQQNSNLVSLRGGNTNSYYIHPQNYRKKCKDVWFTILDRVEKGIIPDIQREKFDLAGSYYDWCIPKRNEEIVVVTLLRNVSYERFLRTFNSIISQSYENFGWIIIDDNSNNGISILIESLIKKENLENKITFVKNRFRFGIAANTFKAIHYFIENNNSIIVIVDGDDALIGKDVLKSIKYKYDNGADVTIGKMYRADKLYAHYPYVVNFINPRDVGGGNVWQHLRTFKKYLYDSISLLDFKYNQSYIDIKERISKQWFEHCIDYSYMIPIVEMASSPAILDSYNYFHERFTPSIKIIRSKKDLIIKDILNRRKYNKDDIITNNRIDFEVNANKIEIDITYSCNLRCISCNRSCTQAPSNDYMTIGQIKSFINESIKLNKKWELINILGGEPTLHPNFENIVKLILHDYVYLFSSNTILQITSNGYTKETRRKLEIFKNYSQNIFIDFNSFKSNRNIEYFTPFNIAPIDNKYYLNKDYSKGCWVTSYCGIGLNRYGYYPCGVSGGIDRVIGKDIGIKNLKEINKNSMKKILNELCKYCGNFIDYEKNKGNFIPRCEKNPFNNEKMTKTWKNLYDNYNERKPFLSLIYE